MTNEGDTPDNPISHFEQYIRGILLKMLRLTLQLSLEGGKIEMLEDTSHRSIT